MSHQSSITNSNCSGPNNFTQSTVQAMSNQVVHVRSDSDNQLEELFKVVELDGQGPQLPFRMRNLPKSFFNPGPPEPMPQSVAETPGFINLNVHNHGLLNNNNIASSLPITHSRARSSPATLQATLRAASTPPIQHVRQHSYDIAEDNQNNLPQGWEVARTPDGHRYFINHIKQITTWHDPRKVVVQPPITRSPTQQQSPNVSLQNLGPLPSHWEQSVTSDSEVYFINNMDRTTSWFDPRLQEQQQQQQQQAQVNANSMRQQSIGHMNHSSLSPGTNLVVANQPVNQPISQASLAAHQQQLVQHAEQQRRMQMMQLQIEKENLRKRQEEIHREEMRLRQQQAGPTSVNESAGESIQIPEMASLQNDPFLGQNSDLHTRQESADSGLGGMGTSYTLSRTPDDLLGNVDEMDMQDGHKVTGAHDFPTQMEINNMADANDTGNMDSDELVPSLQEDLGSELLHDVESVLNTNKMDSLLTWL